MGNERQPMLTKTALRERGWTPKQIETLLGPPDELRTNPRYRSAAPMQLWDESRVDAAEQGADFPEAQQRLANRRASGKLRTGKRHADQLAWAATVEIHVPQGLDLDRETSRAISDLEVRDLDRGDYSDRCTAEPCHIARWTLNHIRHCRTNYDALVATVPLTVNRDAYATIRRRVDDAIIERYPALAVARECRFRWRPDAEMRMEGAA